jgi:beta-galactosidase
MRRMTRTGLGCAVAAIAATALASEKTPSPWFRSLNGHWRFHWAPSSDTRPAGFFQPGYDAGSRDRIPDT